MDVVFECGCNDSQMRRHNLTNQSGDGETSRVSRGMVSSKNLSATVIALRLAFQSLGVVYGDLGTSPLYVLHSTFPNGIDNSHTLMGVLSCIIYSLTLIPLIKYTFFVLRANDHGEGGTFALYSLICQHARVNTILNHHPIDTELTADKREPINRNRVAGKIKTWLESNSWCRSALLLLVLLGTCMTIGDGILTPAISVLSSVSGIKVSCPQLRDDVIVVIACIILAGLFLLQRFGTEKVGWMFAPVVLVWFSSIGIIGVFNILKHEPSIFRALSPHYAIYYFIHHKKDAWISLGGIILSVTGTEAFYADISHFSSSSIQIAFTFLVFPCLVLAYMGQVAYLTKYPEHVDQAFYRSIPSSIYWPMFAVATVSAIIASQATISATFSIIKQAHALGCFPSVKLIRTSSKMLGQVYIPEINWILMVLCISVIAGFQKTTRIGNAYGLAVVGVMLVTTILMTVVMILVWQSNIILTIIFTSFFLFIEFVYLSSVFFKLGQGGWAPLVIAVLFLVVMYAWHYGTRKRHEYEVNNKVPMEWIFHLGSSLGSAQVPGVGLVYTEIPHGVPSVYTHFVTHLPALHSVVMFVCVMYLPINSVPSKDRILIRRIGSKSFFLYRCIVRYGYKDLHIRDDEFERNLMDHLTSYIERSSMFLSAEPMKDEFSEISAMSTFDDSRLAFVGNRSYGHNRDHQQSAANVVILLEESRQRQTSFSNDIQADNDVEDGFQDADERQALLKAKEEGIVHIIGDVIIRANRDSNILKKVVIDYIYNFLSKICREDPAFLDIPHESMFRIGQIYLV